MRKLTIAVLILLVCAGCGPGPEPGSTRTPEPLVPTPRATEPTRAVTPAALPDIAPLGRERFGVGVPFSPISDYEVEQLGIGWYLNWRVEVDPPRPGGVDFWQMVRVSEESFRPEAATIRAAASANPGSIWLIGNEPDVAWQDDTTPERYAQIYHELYQLLKSTDPTCRVAIGGVSQPTPMRLAYLERVLSAYREHYGEPMPVDVWNVHAFILREERDSWGVGIPPGMDANAGELYEIDDHDDLEIFRQQILAFRRWMAEHGQRERPLVVSEYGIVMPADYGFDQQRVQEFMHATFDYFLTATDEEVGYPADDNRLVQWWAWYSLADTMYPTGNLFDPETKLPTPLGEGFARYERSPKPQRDQKADHSRAQGEKKSLLPSRYSPVTKVHFLLTAQSRLCYTTCKTCWAPGALGPVEDPQPWKQPRTSDAFIHPYTDWVSTGDVSQQSHLEYECKRTETRDHLRGVRFSQPCLIPRLSWVRGAAGLKWEGADEGRVGWQRRNPLDARPSLRGAIDGPRRGLGAVIRLTRGTAWRALPFEFRARAPGVIPLHLRRGDRAAAVPHDSSPLAVAHRDRHAPGRRGRLCDQLPDDARLQRIDDAPGPAGALHQRERPDSPPNERAVGPDL